MKFARVLVAAAIALSPLSAAMAQPAAAPDLGLKVEIEPKAMAIVKAMADKLAAAKSMSFTAVATYESPDRTGLPLLYLTTSDVTMQRPNKLKVISPGDGPRTEFWYDGKTVQAYDPAAKLVAVVNAPDTIDAMLRAAFQHAAIYFPFTDLVVSDPLAAISEKLKIAFVVGQSAIVGGVATDIVVLVTELAHVQLWIGRDDKLPRMMTAIFPEDPAKLRHTVVLSNWKLDPPLAADAFTFTPPAGTNRIPFAPPGASAPAAK
ncbi:MAG: DUF2092 domain-containing protein [Proteobacteria bacterium]|nr:DUF2092 domain-containing protein [Pseudomonadota bacterium]